MKDNAAIVRHMIAAGFPTKLKIEGMMTPKAKAVKRDNITFFFAEIFADCLRDDKKMMWLMKNPGEILPFNPTQEENAYLTLSKDYVLTIIVGLKGEDVNKLATQLEHVTLDWSGLLGSFSVKEGHQRLKK